MFSASCAARRTTFCDTGSNTSKVSFFQLIRGFHIRSHSFPNIRSYGKDWSRYGFNSHVNWPPRSSAIGCPTTSSELRLPSQRSALRLDGVRTSPSRSAHGLLRTASSSQPESMSTEIIWPATNPWSTNKGEVPFWWDRELAPSMVKYLEYRPTTFLLELVRAVSDACKGLWWKSLNVVVEDDFWGSSSERWKPLSTCAFRDRSKLSIDDTVSEAKGRTPLSYKVLSGGVNPGELETRTVKTCGSLFFLLQPLG